MIPKYRNRGIALSVIATVVTAGLIYSFASANPFYHSDNGAPIAFLFFIAWWILWFAAGISLAKAKGHSSDSIGPVLMVLFVFSICVPALVIVVPIAVIFGLKDRTNRHR